VRGYVDVLFEAISNADAEAEAAAAEKEESEPYVGDL
jgi:hypothetical protein